ncbi:motility associated factor glycosyltransferase family protein [Paenibacillus tritici]|uniref:motility associated factor glycosyltransferase family protein n=1 Tax=Paenibacillus tritici TaxID=1873425 RepID=UPI001BAB9574|nr:6-hydroxymethylpterin diphosphokinase MptE-like protein [Paenibacillus tritici]QUL54553.1 motility associated factor glycosyltransferase family protein [Paenibacillus tritici]
MKLLDRNIQVLSRNSSHWICEQKEERGSEDLIHRDGEGNEFIQYKNEMFLVKTEIEKSSRPNPLKRELIFVMGIYSIEEIQKLIQTMSKESFLIIIEPNPAFFSYTLNKRDLSFFRNFNVILFADELSNLSIFLDKIFSTSLIYYLKNIRFYFTYFYRSYAVDICTYLVRVVKETAKYKAMLFGNSIEDSLTGFKHNMKNLHHLVNSKDVSCLKNLFKNKPAIVVAAGPSLNKNIDELKKMKSKAVIIAVDTIAKRLCEEGIIPDFICSIERDKETYSYFYENKIYPSETSIVAPLLLYPEIFNEFAGDIIIPMRENVGEYIWLQQILGLVGDNSISLGLSCAHVAFGFAEHIGASPIILVGQDLAFGDSEEESHAGGTIYDNKDFTNEVFSAINKTYTEGYYGGSVPTTDIWINFRKWFEIEIFNENMIVVNATEGGAKIESTIQMSLKEAAEQYCSQDMVPVKEVMDTIAEYPLKKEQMRSILKKQREKFISMKLEFEKQLEVVKGLNINNSLSEKQLLKIVENLSETDDLFEKVKEDWLLRHNLQPIMMSSMWNLYAIEQTLSSSNLIANRDIQMEFLTVSVFVIGEIIAIIEESSNNL